MSDTSSNASQIRVSLDERGSGTVVTITIGNPRKLNSLNTSLLDEFVEVISVLGREPKLRCVIITGASEIESPKAFVGGADISELKDIQTAEAGRAFITRIHLACEALKATPVPVIARVNGHALGGGLLIMTAADLRVADEHALFGMPEVQRGVPSTIESALLPAQIGALRARRLLLLGDTISAQQAESWGLVDKVVQAHQLDEAVEKWVQLILKAGPKALAAQKRLLAVWEQAPLDRAVDAGIWEFGKAFEGSESTSEGRRMMNEFGRQNKLRKAKL